MFNRRLTVVVASLLVGCAAMANETPKYSVVQRLGEVEVRDYPGFIVAETTVGGERGAAGNEAFGRLGGYIFGNNRSKAKLAMTAPVMQEPKREKLAMTAPVTQTGSGAGWVVQFMMPSQYTLEALPEPTDARVTLRQLPPRRFVALRYSGTWSEANFTEHLVALRAAVEREHLQATGEPLWARYDPPFKPWFMRTNEILLELAPPAADAGR
jgi:hypothetical protein